MHARPRGLRLSALLVLALAGLVAPCAATELKVSGVFGDHMVVQRGLPVKVWGWADPGNAVNVNLGAQVRNAIAGPEGRWAVTFNPLAPPGPYTLGVASAGQVVQFQDILVGQVWVCGGQSNMTYPLADTPAAASETAEAALLPDLRLYTVPQRVAERPVADVDGVWQVCGPATVQEFSALAFAYGRELHSALNEPIGLIVSAVGATAAEVWVSREAIAREPLLVRLQDLFDEPVDPDARPELPGVLYNGMIAPLTNLAIAGFTFYQGENNWDRGYEYRTLFPVLIRDWRARWRLGNLPFYYAQIAPWDYPGDDGVLGDSLVAELREAQLMTLSLPGTGMVVTMDVADPADIHSPDKRVVGRRLATWALSHTYGQPRPYSGPLYSGMTVQNHMVRLHFDHAADGLSTYDGLPPSDFLVAGSDRVFFPATTLVYWDQVVVWSPMVTDPVAVRYAWDDAPLPNLVNAYGLPASPFRTDDWPLQSRGGGGGQ